MELEEEVVCDCCTMRYTVFGTFAFCPDCGKHNSLQILEKNLVLAQKQIDLAATVEGELAAQLVADALENGVSAFDGFGRETCRVHASKATNSSKAEAVSFQNLGGAQKKCAVPFSALTCRQGLSPTNGSPSPAVFRSDTYWHTAWASWMKNTSAKQMILKQVLAGRSPSGQTKWFYAESNSKARLISFEQLEHPSVVKNK